LQFVFLSAAHRRGWAILTTDPDFQNYAKVLPMRLHPTSSDR
jgi:hypothetical protein